MADPVLVPCPKGQWTKVATNVTTGIIDLKNTTPVLQTYRMTGNAAPSGQAEGVQIDGTRLGISNTAAIDVYLYPIAIDIVVRVNL